MQEVQYKNNISFREFFADKTEQRVKKKMDTRLAELNSQHGEPVQVTRRKIGRNDPCPCSSGKKFKKCCLSKAL